MAERHHQVLHGAPDCGSGGALLTRRDILQPRDQLFRLLCILFEIRSAGFGNLEWLARTFACRFLDQAHILQERERRIDDPGARRVFAARKLLNGTDKIIAMARLFRNQAQQNEPKLAAFEHATAPPTAAAAAAPSFRALNIKVKWSPVPMPAATAPHGHKSLR